jgi:hypothetical protein
MSSDSLSRQAGVFKLSVVGLACAPFLPTMDQCEPPGPGIASHFLPTALNKKAVALGGPAKPLSKSDENPPLRHYPCRLLAHSGLFAGWLLARYWVESGHSARGSTHRFMSTRPSRPVLEAGSLAILLAMRLTLSRVVGWTLNQRRW